MNPTTPATLYGGSGGGVLPLTTTDNATSKATSMLHTSSGHFTAAAGTTAAPAARMNYLTPPTLANTPMKRIIRKITPIDPKKLQQYGLDRKIAEAVSKHKSSQLAAAAANSSNKCMQKSSNITQQLPSPHTPAVSPRISGTTPITKGIPPNITGTSSSVIVSSSSTTARTSSIVSGSKIISSPTVIVAQPQQHHTAKTSLTTKTIIPPKITITGPEAPTEKEIKQLEALNSEQRLIHVKNLLNKKLLQKKTSTNDDNAKLLKNVKPRSSVTSCAALQDQNNTKVTRKELLTIADKVETITGFVKLKEAEAVTPAKVGIKDVKTKTPQKSPKDIARKLDFQGETTTKTVQQCPVQRSYKKSLSSEICTIPKASVKNSHSHSNSHIHSHSQEQQQLKQTNSSSYNTKEVRQHERQKIDFPEMSPLKIHFPTANVPQETPLPNIDSFKKPYTLSNAAFYNVHTQMKDCNQADYLNTNYGTEPSLVLQQPTVVGDSFNTQFAACPSTTGFGTGTTNSTNCLIVLENKVLSQDEMIDLTELRLSTSKVDKPRFATPHKPIPEVVIKQENSDEYPTTTPPLVTEPETNITQTNMPKEMKATNNMTTTDKVVLSTKQNKKIIINAQKLKLPPDQLANLAKQIAQRTGVSKSNTIVPIQQQSKCHATMSVGPNTIVNTSSNQNYSPIITHPIDNVDNSLINPLTANNNNNVRTQKDASKNDDNYQTFQTRQNLKPKVNLNPKQFIAELPPPPTPTPTPPPPVESNQIIKAAPKVELTNAKQNNNDLDSSEENNSHQFIVIVKEEESRSNDGFNTLQNPIDQPESDTFIKSSVINDYNNHHVKPSSVCYRKPAVEIIDEPVAENDCCFSAVDFIAALNETHPITAETSLELSPEELNLNASFAMSFSPLRINNTSGNSKTHSDVSTSKEYSLLPPKIGNIVDASEKATAINSQQMSTMSFSPLNINLHEDSKTCSDVNTSKEYFPLTHKINNNVDLPEKATTTNSQQISTVSFPPLRLNSSGDSKTCSDINTSKEYPPLTPKIGTIVGVREKAITTNSQQMYTMSFSPLRINSCGDNKAFPDVNTLNEHSSLSTTIGSIVDVPGKAITINSQQMSTVVIASSNGPETILTNANDATIIDITSQNTEVANDLNDGEMVVEKSKNFAEKRNEQSDHNDQTNQSMKDVTNTNNIVVDTEVSDENINPSISNEIPMQKTNIEQHISSTFSKVTPTANSTIETTNKEIVSQAKSIDSNNKSILVNNLSLLVEDIEKPTELPTPAETKNEELIARCLEQPLEVTLETKEPEYASVSSSKNLPLEQTDSVNQDALTITADVKSIGKQSGDSKTNESTLVGSSVTSKRISRFKKGKINLVQRNKTTAGPNKVIAASKKNDKKSKNEDALTTPGEKVVKSNVVKDHEYSSRLSECDEPRSIIEQTSQNKSKEGCEDKPEANKSFDIKEGNLSSESRLNNRELIAPNNNSNNMAKETLETESKIHNLNAECNRLHNSTELVKENGISKAMQSPTVNLSEHQELEKCNDKTAENQSQNTSNETTVSEKPSTNSDENFKMNFVESTVMQEIKKEICGKISNPEAANESHSYEENNKEETILSNENNEIGENTPCNNISQLLEPIKEDIIIRENNLEDVKQPKVSLIDIVKCSPPKVMEKLPVIPFKKHSQETCQKTLEPKGIRHLLKQLKANEKDVQKEEQVSLKENVEKANKERSMPLNTDQTTTLYDSSTNINDIHSAKQLPVSAENLHTKSKNTPLITTRSAAFLGITPPNIVTRRTRLHSKPSETELASPSTSTEKRTRFYSQTFETNNTKLFDTLKTSLVINKQTTATPTKLLTTEESCQDSTHDEKTSLTPSKQRKKLRKTLEDIKKSQKSFSDTDSEDDGRDLVYANEYEESNEFLGFEEDNITNSIKDASPHMRNKHSIDNISLTKTKGGVLKNWLTTGKAISPTLTKDETKDDKRTSPSSLLLTPSVKRSNIPLKKRLDLSANLHEETDITDDTSPADDEDESESIAINKRAKRRVHDVIDIDKNILAYKKIKLDKSSDKSVEHVFTEPRQLRTKSRSSCTESDFNHGKKTPESLSCKSTKELIKNIKEVSAKTVRPMCKTDNSETDSDSGAGKKSKCIKIKENITVSDMKTSVDDYNCSTKKDQRNRKLKSKETSDKLNKVKDTNEDNREKPSSTASDGKKEETEKTKNNSKGFSSDKSTKLTIDDSKACKQKTTKSKHPSEPIADTKACQQNTDKTEILKKDKETKDSSMDSDVKTNCHKDKKLSKRHKSKDDKHKTEISISSVENLDSTKKHKSKNDKRKIEISTLSVQNLDSTKTKNNTDQSQNSEEYLDATLDETDKTLPCLDKNFKKKKKSLIETEVVSPVTKKLKLSGADKDRVPSKQILNSTALEENSNHTSTSSLLITALETQARSDLTKKSSSKRKIKTDNSDSDNKTSSSSAAASEMVKSETPKVKRGKKPSTICNFNPRLLLITKREQLDTDEVLTESQPSNGPIQCGLCLERTVPQKWLLHLAKHYGIGWKVGEEKLDIKRRVAIINYMNAYLKEKSSEGLNCRMCNKTYRSGLGLLTHIETCGMEVSRVICEFCKRDYAQSSLPIHLRSCHARLSLEHENRQTEVETLGENEEVFGNTGRLKRHSTIKAENKLKVIEKELADTLVSDNKKTQIFETKNHIKYVPPLSENDCKKKWAKEIKTCGKGSCPKKACKFNSNDLKELTKHISTCRYIKSGYLCKPCRKRMFKTEKEAIDHVIKTHQNGNESDYEAKTDFEASSDEYESPTDVSDDESADNESVDEDDKLVGDVVIDKSKKKYKSQKSHNQSIAGFQRKKVFDGRYRDLNGETFKKWKSFLKLNYVTGSLFTEFRTEFSIKENQHYLKYLPSHMKSMKFNIAKKADLKPTLEEPESNIEWSELKRFESVDNKMDTFYYLGAPIKFLSWLPLPNDVEEQYLMVAYRRDKYTKYLNPKQHCTILLLFKIIKNKHISELKIHYGFIVPDGPVHNVAFLPSGGYDKTTNRLGLVAVATINSVINVYALPINVQNENTPAKESDCEEDITFIEVKPKFSLILDIEKTKNSDSILLKTQCLRICWSEFSDHKHVFASFSNGFIGIWNITNDSEDNLNRFVVDNFVNFVPVNYFYLGEKGIKSMALHYDTQGPRWLAVAGLNRKFVIYDIKILTQPIMLKDDCAKNVILSMDWCQLWETVLYSYCDTLPNNGRCVLVVNPTNLMFTQIKLDLMAAGVTQIHYSPLTNMCVASVENGDLIFLNPKEMHYECPMGGKRFDERRVLSAMDIKQLNGEQVFELPKYNKKNSDQKIPNDWSMYDENFKNKHGLIFKPFLKLKENMKNSYLSEKRCPPLNVIPFLRINALRCNLNLNAKHLVALGYENGFLRIVYFNKDTQMVC